jgi:hypothetical protein
MPSPQGTPAALPSPSLRRLASTSQRPAAPLYAVLWAARAGGRAKMPFGIPIRRTLVPIHHPPAIANDRLTLNRAGQVVLTLKTPYRALT